MPTIRGGEVYAQLRFHPWRQSGLSQLGEQFTEINLGGGTFRQPAELGEFRASARSSRLRSQDFQRLFVPPSLSGRAGPPRTGSV